MSELIFRNASESDYDYVISVVNEWWGGRNVSSMLPRLFFQHFQNTSFVVVAGEAGSRIVGFLIGFVSQTDAYDGYIHFVGVDPGYRKRGIAEKLYHLFFDKGREFGCKRVSCVTSPVNKLSITFHRNLGFTIQPGNSTLADAVPVTLNYDGPNEDRVRFTKEI